ncbi:unnamed protein product [Sympodiomycopsis kandeliae]
MKVSRPALCALSLLLSGVVASQRSFHAHAHAHAHDHSDEKHMREVHGVYRNPSEDGQNPYILSEPDYLTYGDSFDGSDDGINVETPSDDALWAGLGTFAHLPYGACLSPITSQLPNGKEVQPGDTFDIAILGIPFDSAVTFRPGARFAPSGIRHNSKRMAEFTGYNVPLDVNVYHSGQKILDCGDIPVTSFDTLLALQQMQKGYSSLLKRGVSTGKNLTGKPLFTKDGQLHPKIVTLGGDHTIVLPILRSLNEVYGPVSVIHFDSHLDTWAPSKHATKRQAIHHGSYFWHASNEGLVRNGTSSHAGIRGRVTSPQDFRDDREVGFQLSQAHEIDDIGVSGIIKHLRDTVKDSPVYLSIDIDVLDPSIAPATGTPETGGWSSREFRKILRGLEGLNIVGADVVEVSPVYDTQAAVTQLLAGEIIWDILGMLVNRGPLVEAA